MQNEDLKIDVGDGDEQEQEIDLEAQPEQEQPEEKPEIEVSESAGVTHEEKEEVQAPKEELAEYSEGVQKRIAKLTKKMREAERQKEEAITYAQNQQAEVEKLRSKYSKLDTNYTAEFEKRVTTNIDAAKAKLASAIAAGNIEEQVAAQTEIATLAMDANRLASIKDVKEATAARAEAPVQQQQVPMQQPRATIDPKADEWASKNSWFGSDNAMTYTAFDIHKSLVEEEGFDPQSEEYYAEVDKRIRLEFPHKFDTNKESASEPVQNVASAKRPAVKGRRKTVKLTPSQVAISKRLGVPLEEYAKQLAAKEV
jgi:hypothetical protein